jgi:hypothetical protein
MKPAWVVGAAALSPHGHDWRGLGAFLASGARVAGAVPPGYPRPEPRARKLMARAAELAAVAMHAALASAGWLDGRAAIGAFLGVGASGGDEGEMSALIAASTDPASARFSPLQLGERGLAAATPLLSFQLMQSFTLCHGAILEGVGGPNAAFFSRGAGTTRALIEALWALADGDCARTLAGGADSAHHPITQAELQREGHAGTPAAEGAALLALAAAPGPAPLALVDHAAAAGPPPAADAVITVGGGGLDVLALGQTLAAAPALAWAAALDLLERGAERVAVVGGGLDGPLGAVRLRRPR